MITCSKTYYNIPFAHRQPLHGGHCQYVHGHNWAIKFTFLAKERDENGFVIDFGKLHFIKDWIDQKLDHALLICKSDPYVEYFTKNASILWKLHLVDDASCEGLCDYIHEQFKRAVTFETNGRVVIKSVEVFEDDKNSALLEVGV